VVNVPFFKVSATVLTPLYLSFNYAFAKLFKSVVVASPVAIIASNTAL